MGRRAKPDVCFEALIRLALPALRAAERAAPRTGRGDRPDIPDWLIAGVIMVAILRKKKSKSAQYRFLCEHRAALAAGFGTPQFPSRSTYFRRYRRAHTLYREAVRQQGDQAIREKIADPTDVAVDKSLVPGLGPPWHTQERKAGVVPAGVDIGATWGYSAHDGWVQGFSYEVVVTATPRGIVFPLLASADTASASETKTFARKVGGLPTGAKTVSADSGYDANDLGEAVEYDAHSGKPTGRRFLCPENPRNNKRPKTKPGGADAARARSRARRAARKSHLNTRRGRRTYARRNKTVEPFNHWLKRLFELETQVWHRGLDNNRTQLLAAIFCYQLLVRFNHKHGHKNGCICWILDAL
jgi:hypothetical protein